MGAHICGVYYVYVARYLCSELRVATKGWKETGRKGVGNSWPRRTPHAHGFPVTNEVCYSHMAISNQRCAADDNVAYLKEELKLL